MEVLHTHETTVQKEEDICKQNIKLVEFTADQFEDIHDKKKEIYLNNLRVGTYLCGHAKRIENVVNERDNKHSRTSKIVGARQQALKDQQDRLERARQQHLGTARSS